MISADVGADFHVAANGSPLRHAFASVHGSAARKRRRHMRDDRAFRQEKTPVRLKDRDDVAGQVISREPCRELSGVEYIAREPELRTRFERPGDWPAACEACVDAAPDDEQLFAGMTFQLPPERVGAAEQRDVAVMFPVGQTDDSSQPM